MVKDTVAILDGSSTLPAGTKGFFKCRVLKRAETPYFLIPAIWMKGFEQRPRLSKFIPPILLTSAMTKSVGWSSWQLVRLIT